MKNTILKYMPIAAALLLAVSCTKDDDTTATIAPQLETSTNTISDNHEATVPFTIKVVTGNKISKIGCTDNGAQGVQLYFTQEEVDKLTMDLYDQGNQWLGQLTLKNVDGTFSGKVLKTLSVGEEIVCQTSDYPDDSEEMKETSDISLEDLLEHTPRLFAGSFTYGEDESVQLTDMNAYLEIFMSPNQHRILYEVSGPPSFTRKYELNSEGKIWIAFLNVGSRSNLDGKKTLDGFHFLKPFDVKPGNIYTIDRSGWVDLGLDNQMLWADANLSGPNAVEKDGNYFYNFENATKDLPEHASLPSGSHSDGSEIKMLFQNCNWVPVYDDNNVFVGYNVFEEGLSDPDKHPHIYLPAARGLEFDEAKQTYKYIQFSEKTGVYWTNTKRSDTQYYSTLLREPPMTTDNIAFYIKTTSFLSVRPVRHIDD